MKFISVTLKTVAKPRLLFKYTLLREVSVVWWSVVPLTLFHMGGAFFAPPPNQTFLHCAETTQDMMTKLCDFYSNLIGKQNLNVSLF